MPRIKRRGYVVASAVGAFVFLGILILYVLQIQPPVLPLKGGGHFEVMETAQGSNLVFHVGDRRSMALYQIFGRHVPNRFKTVQYPMPTMSTNSMGILLNKPITEDDSSQRRALNGSFSLSLVTPSGQEHFGLQRWVNFHSVEVGNTGANRLTDEQIIFEFTNSPPAYTRLRMYQTNVSQGKVTVTTNEIPFTPER